MINFGKRLPVSSRVVRFGVAVALLLLSSPLSAASFRLDTTILGQVRENEELQQEIPVNGYLGLGFNQSKWNFSGETNMRFFRDFARDWDDYDLYQAVLHFLPVPTLKIDFGRQFVSEGFFASVLDGIKLTVMPSKYVDITLYTGIPRSVEVGDFNENDGLLTGLSVGMRNVPRTNAQFHVAWRKNDVSFKDFKQNDEIFVGANVSHQFDVASKPNLYGLVEYNVTGGNIDAGTLGLDLYPAKWLALNMEFDTFNVNRDSDQPTILGIFTRGRTYSGHLSTTWTLVPDVLDFVQNYSYQNVEVLNGARRNGHLLDTAFQVSFDNIGLYLEPGYYFSNSFGGTVNGVRTLIHEQFTKKFYSEAYVDFARYNKITGQNNSAFSTVLWSGYEVLKGWTISGGLEYNQNVVFTKDVRGSFKIDYHFKHGT